MATLLLAAAVVTPTLAQTAQCGLAQPAFCDTFDQPAGTGTRSGQLNGTVWGVSRTIGAVNFGQGQVNAAPSTALVGCSGTSTVRPPNDVIICNGQLREATNDNPSGQFEAGGVTALAMYPKQPFDFAGRTGKITFDVANDSHGSHAAWPELWVTNLPVPAPFAHFGTWLALPQYGFGLRFSGATDGGGNQAPCPQGSAGYTGVLSAIVINNYVANDTENGGSLRVIGSGCVKQPAAAGQLNHYEVDVSQGQIDVYGTDAGTVAPLKHLATIPNAGLGFTRGLIWIEDVHYNADKADPNNPSASQKQHTFVWDNVGFDGPFTYHDLSYDALDNTQANSDGTVNLGKGSGPNQSASWNVLGMPANPSAAAVRVLFNFYHYTPPTVLNLTVNGHAHQVPWPYPDTTGFTWRTFAVTIPITDLVAGTNVVTIGGDQTIATSNVDIVLVNVDGSPTATPVPPTATAPTVPPTATPTATVVPTSTAVPTATVVPTDTPQPVATDTTVATVEPTATMEPTATDQPTPCLPEQVTVNVVVTVGTQQQNLTFCQ